MNKATVLSPYAASLTLRRTGLNFIFSANRGCAATPLHPCLRADAPYRGFKFRSLRSPNSDLSDTDDLAEALHLIKMRLLAFFDGHIDSDLILLIKQNILRNEN